eukprot:tig00000829_g4647.t1
MVLPVVFNEHHGVHAAPVEFLSGELVPSFEKPERADLVMQALRSTNMLRVEVVGPREFDDSHIEAVHDRDYLDYLRNVFAAVKAKRNVPHGVFPDTMNTRAFEHTKYRRPSSTAMCCGYYCYDMSTPVLERTYEASRLAANCALTGAKMLLEGETQLVYALCRPPGHHAGRAFYGGYCYINNAAVAAALLRGRGGPNGTMARIAILDIDFHHGNGTQEIFYDDSSVLYTSLHADPDTDYPYYSGYVEEKGMGSGAGANINVPLPPGTGMAEYVAALRPVLSAISTFNPAYLIISAGFDTLMGDPIGSFTMRAEEYGQIGLAVREALKIPTLVVHEGGYNLADMPTAVVHLLAALHG